MSDIHYIFRDGQTYAIREGKVIAANVDPDEVERQVRAHLDVGIGASITTPNGLKGTILGKTASVWGEEVTIRLENGRIVRLPVGTELQRPKTAKKLSPVEQLEMRLSATSAQTREGLTHRYDELSSIKHYAAALIRDGASWEDAQRLDSISVTADVEQAEIQDAITAMDDAESYAPSNYSMGVADEAAGISREDASWLDNTLDEMIAEAEATDFGRLMDEGPEALTAEMADSALGDSEVTHSIASSFIKEKTAGVDRKVADPYINTFLARVERCRLDELARRAEEVPTTTKEAAAEDPFKDIPDDAIFLT